MDFAKTARHRRLTRVATRLERALHSLPPEEQGILLAHLVSLWIAGHFVMQEFGQPQQPETGAMRKSLLQNFARTVVDMLPEAERDVLAKTTRGEVEVEVIAEVSTKGPIH